MRWWIVILLVVAGFVLRVWGLSDASLNSDETYTAKAAFHPELVNKFDDIHPPLYTLAVRAASGLVRGPIEAKTRLASALAGALVIALMAWMGFIVFGAEGAILAALLAAFDPGCIMLSRVARPYALSAFMLGLTLPATWAVVKKPNIPRMIALGLVNLAALLTFYYAFYLCAVQVFVALIAGRRDRMVRWRLIGANVIAACAFTPWLVTLWRQLRRLSHEPGWGDWPLSPYQVARRGVQVLAQNSPLYAPWRILYLPADLVGAIGISILILTVLVFAWRTAIKRGADLGGLAIADREGRMSMGLPLVFIALSYSAAAICHRVLGVYVSLHYFSFLAAPIMVLVILALAGLPTRNARAAVVAVILGTQIIALPFAGSAPAEDLRQAVRVFDAEAGPQSIALTSAHFIKDAFTIYSSRKPRAYGLPSDLPGHTPVTREGSGVMRPEDKAAFFALVGQTPEVWLVLSHEQRNGVDRGGVLARQWLEGAGFERIRDQRADGVRWEEYVRLGFKVSKP